MVIKKLKIKLKKHKAEKQKAKGTKTKKSRKGTAFAQGAKSGLSSKGVKRTPSFSIETARTLGQEARNFKLKKDETEE